MATLGGGSNDLLTYTVPRILTADRNGAVVLSRPAERRCATTALLYRRDKRSRVRDRGGPRMHECRCYDVARRSLLPVSPSRSLLAHSPARLIVSIAYSFSYKLTTPPVNLLSYRTFNRGVSRRILYLESGGGGESATRVKTTRRGMVHFRSVPARFGED